MNRNNGIPGGKWQASASCLVAILALTLGIGDAFAGPRGGGSSGRMAQTSVSGASRATASSANRAGRGSVSTGNVNRGNANTGNVNRGNVNTGNVNRGNVNTGNINVGNDINVDIDRDIDRDHCCGWGGAYYHPIATGVVIGAVAVTTAAVVGSYYYSLPPTGCTTVIKNGVSYTQCGTVYYQKVMSGNDVVYMVVQP